MCASSLTRPCIRIEDLPDVTQDNVTFSDTAFPTAVDENRLSALELPSPQEVLSRSRDGIGGIVRFESVGLVVKFGPADYVRFEEAQAMIAVRQAFPRREVPVPEVLAWRTYDSRRFIYMSLIEGETLRDVWCELDLPDKKRICTQLKRMMSLLRNIIQDSPNKTRIGSVGGGSVQDRFFKLDYENGPFEDTKLFNDWLLAAATRQTPGPYGEVKSDGVYRPLIPDNSEICFTHGDLSLGNTILLKRSETWTVVGIIDWEQAGWYPDYWEYCKMCFGVECDHEWRDAAWVDLILAPVPDETLDAVATYFSWRQPN